MYKRRKKGKKRWREEKIETSTNQEKERGIKLRKEERRKGEGSE